MKLWLYRLLCMGLALSLVSAAREKPLTPMRLAKPTKETPGEATWRLDERWAEDLKVAIEWREDWDKTVTASRQKWEAELPKDRTREARIRGRLLAMYESLIRKFPEQIDRHAEAHRQIAEYLRSMGYPLAAAESLRKAMEAAPGRADVAVSALYSPVRVPEEWPAEIVEYSAKRVLALNRVGQLGDTEQMVIDAWRALAVAHRRQGRLMEAAEALEKYHGLAGPTSFHRQEEANLYAAAGHVDEALLRWQAIAAETEDRDRNREMRTRISRLSASQTVSVGRFAGHEALSIKWSIMRLRPPTDLVADFLALIEEDPGGQNVVPWDDVRYSSLWSGVDRYLRELGEPALVPIRAAQEAKATAINPGDDAANLSAFRRFPWARSTHESMLELGQRKLRRGELGLARRCFEDVLSHSADAELRRRAEIGMRMAQTPPVTPAEPAPLDAWTEMNAPAIDAWPAELLQRVPAELASAVPWAGPSVHVAGDKVILTGPAMLACYGQDLSRPLWIQSSQWPAGQHGSPSNPSSRLFTLPGSVRPAVAEGRIFARWGIDPSSGCPTSIAAFDVESGRMIWSTLRHPALAGLWPVGDPIASEGRIYWAAAADPAATSAAGIPFFVVCLNAASGQPIWVRRLADLTDSMFIHAEREGRRKEDERDNWRANMARYGNAVSVADGAVYVLTNMGVAARLDARDGVIEWAATYPRAMLTWDSHHIFRRLGGAPVLAGDHVIFAPRDHHGVFAVDRQTGQTAWDRPFAPSASVLGQVDDLLILADHLDLVALGAHTGEIAWSRRLSDGDARKAILRGREIWADAGQGISVFDARSGSAVAARQWESNEPVRRFVFRGGQLLTLTDRLLPAAPLKTPTASAVQPGPWRRAWRLAVSQPRLHLPPATSRLVSIACVTSGQTLSAVDGAGRILWQRVIRPDLGALHFTDDAIVLINGQQVQCIDALAGKLRWERSTPVFIDHSAIAGGCVVVADGDDRRAPTAAGIDLGTGEVAWHRSSLGTPGMERLESLHGISVDGEIVHLIGRSNSFGGLAHVRCRAADGVILSGRGLANAGRDQRRFAIDGLVGIAVSDGGTLTFFDMRSDGAPERGRIELGQWQSESMQEMAAHGQWAYLRTQDSRRSRTRTTILKRGDPAYILQRDEPGIIRGDQFFEVTGRTLAIIDLPSRKQVVQCVVPVPESIDHHTSILDFRQDGSAITVVSGMERGSGVSRRPGDLRVDRFDAKTGMHLEGQVLADAYWQAAHADGRTEENVIRRTQAAIMGQTLLITSGEGISGYIIDDNSPAIPPASVLCFREGRAPLAASTAAGIIASHDDERLYIRVAYPDAQVEPWHGADGYSGGDWLQFALTTNVDALHVGVGVDAQGRTMLHNLSSANLPSGIDVEVRHDLVHGFHTYLLTIPLKRLAHRDGLGHWRNVGVSLIAWDGANSGSPRAAISLGGGVRGRQVLPQHHQRVHLYALSPQEEQAAIELASALPQLVASRRFMKQAGAVRSTEQGVAFYSEYLKRHPAGPMTRDVMDWLDGTIRRGINDDAAARVLKIAEEAGVPETIREQYASAARAYLSQWVWIDSNRPPRMLMLQLNDGSTWEHRVSFGQFQAIWTGTPYTASRRIIGTLPPAGAWQELRIPLSWLAMHDKPVAGLLFGQFGGARIFWDRTAIVVDGREQILIDEQTPEGQIGGFWDWRDERAKSGSRSHTCIPPASDDEPMWHDVSAMKTPGTLHLNQSPIPAAPAAAAIAALEQAMPRLGQGDLAIEYLNAMLEMEGPDPDRRASRLKWFLTAVPNHPANVRILADLLQLAREMKKEDPAAFVDALIAECKVPLRTRYAFRRAHTHTARGFVRDWQVIGPFANINDRGLEFPYAPELERIRLEAEYRGAVEMVKWKPLKSEQEYINLLGPFTPNQQAVAYACCWVKSDKPRPVMLEIGSDDGSKVWINRRLVHSQHEHDYAERGNWRVPAVLSAGWNELLVKIEQHDEEWGFYLELVDPEGRGGLNDLAVQAQVP